MKTKKIVKNALLILGLMFTLALALSSCKKDSPAPEPTPIVAAPVNLNSYKVEIRIKDADDTNYFRGGFNISTIDAMTTFSLNGWPSNNLPNPTYQDKDTTITRTISTDKNNDVMLWTDARINSYTITPTPKDTIFLRAFRNDTLIFSDTAMVFYFGKIAPYTYLNKLSAL